MRSKIAVVGEKASVMGFRAVGFEVIEVEESAEIFSTVERLVKEEYGVVFLTEQALAKAPGLLDKYKDTRIPAIIPIPGRDGTLGIGMQNLRKSVERAVGADILNH
ncbi:MAG: V-type ATP synthase subunit F [Oscillospiraceae bacterium]|jgi:V/A-type H+-transporting ATPase subunit F